jgi:hypothetical protein
MSIAQNLTEIRDQITQAAREAGRDPSEVSLVAVSKTKPAAMVKEALAAGQLVFGENYVQESADKIPEVGPGPEWHFIGHLQSNKAKLTAGLFDWVQTLDRIKLINALDRHAGQAGRVIQVLIQVNVGGEDQKAGCSPGQAAELAQAAAQAPNLRLRGLMTMPPFFDQPERVRPLFAELRRLSHTLARDLPAGSMDHLSMGMSGDFTAAIAEGATLVRVGTAIFGHR